MRGLILDKATNQMNRTILKWVGVMLFTIILGGCLGPPTLRTTVLNYDMITNQIEQELMLLNVARAHRMIAPHFTVTGSICTMNERKPNGEQVLISTTTLDQPVCVLREG
jgi:hypothetical protein